MSEVPAHHIPVLREMAGKTLAWANRMIDGHCGGLLWSKEFERRFSHREKARLLVSVYVGGVVRVRDCDTGHLIAESKPGKPNELPAGFLPECASPALSDPTNPN